MVPNHIRVNSYHRRKFLALAIAIVLVLYVSVRLFWSISSSSTSSGFHNRAKVVFADGGVGGLNDDQSDDYNDLKNDDDDNEKKTKKIVDPRLNEMSGRAAANKIVEKKKIYSLSKEWFLSKCFDGVSDISGMSFDYFDSYLEKMAKSTIEECRWTKKAINVS